ncbi:aminotransferase class I/II-fold pyridoxal phosphate-dependent enzyme [Paraglaciecola aquimarina]|uniref:Aminotransferase class I/II-fold pyridoxal phosphate-dependent enzyme n=1 Tax=Paraglaciecola aquimarina TaxID=1235557 RepID=A0ABU3T187_9ALTE|nr:aminotransferase class I/II-fold pyridoxal phosphate-dependent enzyme [Paraglaciecola aquimarina]MDU0355973.1 aminotransferase class I/II-fold pyridoxal phosphate-dependent enzyme [Paraglaciecola aquimarina]
MLGPWSVSGPAQYIGEQALQDTAWQKQQRDSLQKLSSKLAALLENTFKTPPTGTILFQTIQHNQAPEIFQQLCQQGIYVRLCDEQNALRFGIPTTEQFKRLEKALKTIRFRLKTLPE